MNTDQLAEELWNALHPAVCPPNNRQRGLSIIKSAIEKATARLQRELQDAEMLCGELQQQRDRAAHAGEPGADTRRLAETLVDSQYFPRVTQSERNAAVNGFTEIIAALSQPPTPATASEDRPCDFCGRGRENVEPWRKPDSASASEERPTWWVGEYHVQEVTPATEGKKT